MILSHQHRYLFLKTTKTGGTSLEMALSKYCGPDDVITVVHRADEATKATLGLPGPRNHLLPASDHRPSDIVRTLRTRKAAERFYNHITAAEVRRLVAPAVWDGYLKFSIVRNPFDYVVSRYFWMNPVESHTPERFRAWLLGDPPRLRINRRITHIDGRLATDALLRYESLAEDVAAIARRLGLPDTLATEFAALGAKSGLRPRTATAAAMFDGFDEGVAFVREAFADDIRDFGYTLG